jgi:polyisoprenoid-binding protein YceI
MSTGCKIHLLGAALVAMCLAGCPTRPRVPASPTEQQITGQAVKAQPTAAHEGRPYDIASSESLLIIVVYRGGALAKAGHNHVIASHNLTGTIYVPADIARSSFEVHLPVSELSVDEAALRAKEEGADFPPDIPDSAKEGTRRNMLSAALLDGEHYPEIVLRSERLEPAPGGSESQWLAQVQITLRGNLRSITVPVHYEPKPDELVVSGEFPLKQSDLGLTPFSALLGALQVLDDMKVKFRIVAARDRSIP